MSLWTNEVSEHIVERRPSHVIRAPGSRHCEHLDLAVLQRISGLARSATFHCRDTPGCRSWVCRDSSLSSPFRRPSRITGARPRRAGHVSMRAVGATTLSPRQPRRQARWPRAQGRQSVTRTVCPRRGCASWSCGLPSSPLPRLCASRRWVSTISMASMGLKDRTSLLIPMSSRRATDARAFLITAVPALLVGDGHAVSGVEARLAARHGWSR